MPEPAPVMIATFPCNKKSNRRPEEALVSFILFEVFKLRSGYGETEGKHYGRASTFTLAIQNSDS
jgi:hypothetical protein